MPIPFADYGKACSDLFSDHHQAGSIKFAKKGSVGSGDAKYEFTSNTCVSGGKPVEWLMEVDAGSINIKHDHTGKIEKELSFDVKQVAGLNLKWKPVFSQAAGLNLGDLNVNYTHEKAHLDLNMALPTPNSADFEMSLAPLNGCSKLNFGLKGSLGMSGLSNASFGWHCAKGDLQSHFKSNDLTNCMQGITGVYQYLPNNKHFCCYGVEFDSKASTLALAAATGCCANTTRFKVDQTGTLNVAKVSKLNKSVSLNVSAALNMTQLGAGDHKFGMGLSFE